jgi:hypothetical protein
MQCELCQVEDLVVLSVGQSDWKTEAVEGGAEGMVLTLKMRRMRLRS